MISILFVDDEAPVLDGLRRSLYCMREEWRMRFCTNGADALQQLSIESADVVISDMRMPSMDGSQLLAEVKRHHPHAIRFILSGQAERDSVIRATRNAHRYLSKPFDAPSLKTAIARAIQLRTLLANEALSEIVGNVDALPTPPTMYVRLRECLRGAETSIDDVVDLIQQDVALTTKVLKLANSGYFARRVPVESIKHAVSFLGTDTVSALVLGNELFDASTTIVVPEFSLVRLGQHGLETAAWARAVALHEGFARSVAEQAFLAGILHDVGRLVFATRKPPSPTQDRKTWLGETTLQMIAHHAAVGAYLLGLWAFPEPIVEAALWHHCPSQSSDEGLSLSGLVHIADQLTHAADPHSKRERALEAGYLESLNMASRWEEWVALRSAGLAGDESEG